MSQRPGIDHELRLRYRRRQCLDVEVILLHDEGQVLFQGVGQMNARLAGQQEAARPDTQLGTLFLLHC